MTDSPSNSTAQIQREWTGGSYPTLARTFLPLAARLVDAAAIEPGKRVLDVRKSLCDFRNPSEISDF